VAWCRSILDVHSAPLNLYEVSPKARSANNEVSNGHDIGMLQAPLRFSNCLAASVPAENKNNDQNTTPFNTSLVLISLE